MLLHVSLEWTPDREHCPTVCTYLSSSFTWWRLFLVRGHLLLLHFGRHTALHVSGVNSRRNSLARWSLYKENHKMWWKRIQNIEPFGSCSQQLISVLKCLQGKTTRCFAIGMSSLIGRNLGFHILNIATGVYLPERFPCLTWMQITKITHNSGHETKIYLYIKWLRREHVVR